MTRPVAPQLAPSPALAAYLLAFWLVSTLAFLTRLERYSAAFAGAAALLLGLGLGLALVLAARAAHRRRPGTA